MHLKIKEKFKMKLAIFLPVLRQASAEWNNKNGQKPKAFPRVDVVPRLLVFLISLLSLTACSSKMIYPPNKKFLKENKWQEVVIFPTPHHLPSSPEAEDPERILKQVQNDIADFPIKSRNARKKFHLDGYGNFDYYFGFLAKKIKFKKNKQQLELENAFLFTNILPIVKNFRNRSVLKIPYKKHKLPLNAEVNPNCQNYRTIIIHTEAVKYWEDWIVAYKCCVNDNGSIRYDKVYDNQFFTINNWEWYNIVFRDYNLGVK